MKANKLRFYFALLICLTLFATPGVLCAQNKLTLQTDSGQSIPDTLLFKLQKAQAAITEINAANTKGYGSAEVRTDLAQVLKDLRPISADLQAPGKVIDPKTLSSYGLILNNSQGMLDRWQKRLSKTSNELQRMSREVVSLSNDTLLNVKANDATARKLYARQVIDVKLRLQQAGKANSASLDTISRLLADVSAAYLKVTGLQANISERQEASGRSVLRREAPYIWRAPWSKNGNSIGQLLQESFAGQKKILGYFIESSWDNRLLLLLVTTAFFLWVYFNFKKTKDPKLKEKIGEVPLTYLSPIPIIGSLILWLNIVPVFEPDAPAPYIELVQFALLLLLTFVLYRKLEKSQWQHWLVIVVLYAVIVFLSAAVHDTLLLRLILIGLNSISLYIGSRLYHKLSSANIAPRFVKPVLFIYATLHALAILLNVFGRISLAKVYTVTAMVGLTQVIGLAVFIQIFSEALELQIKVSACNGGLFTRLDVSRTRATVRRALSVIAVIIWLLVFFINLSIAGGVFAFIHQVLIKPRTFGSISFNLGNVLFFALIIYVSNLLQKHVGILFGEQSVSFSNQVEHKSSKLTLIRLIIALAGVLLAVTASGIPVDKLTVVLGALSVGIGLGMQNIVNNFVSGIILIFEKPFQIGDFIELADKKGKIQDIGIRSSKMLTQQGGQVVIPNADLIANRLTNWTIDSAYIRSEVLFKVHLSSDINQVIKIIREEIAASAEVIKNSEPEVMINAVTADSVEMKAYVWISSVYVEPGFKSALYSRLISSFAAAQIKLM